MRIWFFIVSILALSACVPEEKICPDIDNKNPNQVIVENKSCESTMLTVELALTQTQQIQGLMNRTSMPEDAGMLFIFNKEIERGFWMKNTLIPLDMIFVKKNGLIHHIHPNAKPNDLTSVKSNGPVIAVLEINGGMAKKLGIKVGDIINHPFFNRQQAQ